ncbi:MAG TPA: hypothetical protein VME01_09585 [Solirubrobacteraceae bacterium]|nr:hypothetical protein [Solirubrobacteraceae bacterium]
MRRFASLTLLALVAATALAACGGSSKPSKTASDSSAKASSGALAMAACMRHNGVPNFPDPSGNGGGIQVNDNNGQMTVNGVAVSAPAFQHAMQVCQNKLPHGPPLSSAQIASIRKQALKMAECMRSHGVPNFPDPQIVTGPGGRGVGIKIGAAGGGLNPQSPAFQKAQQVCSSKMGGRPGIAVKVKAA